MIRKRTQCDGNWSNYYDGILWLAMGGLHRLLDNPFHRIFRLLGGSWPEGAIQFFTFFPFFWALIMLGSKTRRLEWGEQCDHIRICFLG